jgi:hypothetical protein
LNQECQISSNYFWIIHSSRWEQPYKLNLTSSNPLHMLQQWKSNRWTRVSSKICYSLTFKSGEQTVCNQHNKFRGREHPSLESTFKVFSCGVFFMNRSFINDFYLTMINFSCIKVYVYMFSWPLWLKWTVLISLNSSPQRKKPSREIALHLSMWLTDCVHTWCSYCDQFLCFFICFSTT